MIQINTMPNDDFCITEHAGLLSGIYYTDWGS